MEVCRLCGFKTEAKDIRRFLTSFEKQFICRPCVEKIVKQAKIRGWVS